MYTQKAYTPVGGEGTSIGTEVKQAKDTTSTIYVNGSVVNLKGYNINNNNYFKLRDLGAALGVGIDWDSATKTVIVDSTGSAEAQKPANQEGTPQTSPTGKTGKGSWDGVDPELRIKAGQETTLDPSDPNHPGWKADGGFMVATLKPGQEAPDAVGYDYGGAIGESDWEGIIIGG